MHTSALTVLSLAFFASIVPVQVAASKAGSSSLSRRSPQPDPAAQAQAAPSKSKKSTRRRRRRSSIPSPPVLLSSSNSSIVDSPDTPFVKQRNKRWTNPKPRRVPVNPKFAKRSTTPSVSYSLVQDHQGGYSFFDGFDFFNWPDPTHLPPDVFHALLS